MLLTVALQPSLQSHGLPLPTFACLAIVNLMHQLVLPYTLLPSCSPVILVCSICRAVKNMLSKRASQDAAR